MAYLVCHMQKHGSGAIGGIQSHNERERESKSNPDIDYNRSEDNYSLVECDSYRKAIKTNIDELQLKRAVRKDAVLACSFVVTSSQDYFRDKSPEDTKAFFADAVEFFKDRYGEKNVFSATVHMDEATPHLHLLLTPIHDGKLCAKTLFDRKELRSLQTDLHASVGLQRGLERGQEGSGRVHLSETRFKLEKTSEAARAAEQKLAATERKLDLLTPKLLSAEEVERKKFKRTLLSRLSSALGFGESLKGITYAELESLKMTALDVEKSRASAATSKKRADAADRRADAAEAEANEKLKKGIEMVRAERNKLRDAIDVVEKERALVAEEKAKTPSAKLLTENQELRAEVKDLQDVFGRAEFFLKFHADAVRDAVKGRYGGEGSFDYLEKAVQKQAERSHSRSRGLER